MSIYGPQPLRKGMRNLGLVLSSVLLALANSTSEPRAERDPLKDSFQWRLDVAGIP